MKNSTRINRALAAKKKIFLFLTLLTLSVGQMWGANATMAGGTNATSSTFSSASGYKCGTGKAGGSMTVTIPANATVLSVYIAAWNGESPSVSISRSSGTISSSSVSPSSDSGISGSGTSYTLANAESTYLQTFTLSNVGSETTVTFSTSAKNKRFGVWGAKICYSPTSPTNTTIGSTTATLGWSDAKNVNSYEVYYSTSSTPPTASSSGTTTTSKSINLTSLTSSQQYYWWVRAYDSYCKTAWVAGTSFTTTASGCTNKVNITNSTTTNVTNGSFTVDKTGEQNACSALSVTVTPTPDPHYHVASVSATNPATSGTAGAANDNGDGTYTITYSENAKGNTTISVTFDEDTKYTLNYHDGSGDGTKNNVYEGTNLISALGTPAASCDATSTTFQGWSTTEIATKTDTKPTLVAANAVVNSTTAAEKYYAVYAKNNTGSWSITSIDQLTSGSGYATYNGSHTASGTTYTSNQVMQNSGIQFQSSAGYIYNTTAMAYDITSIVIESSSTNWSVYTNGSAISSTPASGAIVISSSNNTRTFTVSSTGHKYFHIKGGASTPKATSITVNYGTTKDYMTTCCQPLAQINGSVSLSQLANGKLQASWDSQTSTDGWATPGIIIKIYEDGNATPVVTSSALANNTTSFTATDFTPKTCTNYYATLTALHGDDASYCAGDLVSAPSANVTTAGYTYVNNSTNVNLVAALPASTCANGGADVNIQFTAAAGYRLPSTDEEIDANVSVTNAGEKDEDWSCGFANDVLTITVNPTKATGNIGIEVDGIETVVPEISVSKDEIDFDKVKKGVATSTTFTVEGANLSNNITLSSDEEAFTLSTYSLTQEDGAVALTTITLTANTTTAGEYMGTITISDGNEGATDKTIDVYLTVLETYTVNWYVNGSLEHTQTDVANTAYDAVPSDFSAFTDCEDLHFVGWKEGAIDGGSTTSAPSLANIGTKITANKDYYAVFAEGTPASTETVLEESLSSGISTEGWTFNNKCYTLNSAVRMSTGSDPGTMTSPALSSLDGDATLTFEVKAWSSTENGKVALSASKGTFGTTNFTTSSSDDFEEVSSTLSGGDATTTITFTGTAGYRISIKNVKVTKTVAEDYSMYYTTCPHVSRVTLSAPSVSNGSISFEQSGSAVTSVRTDGGADVDVDVVAAPSTGYELTGVALSGTAASHASYDAGVITIDAGTEGALTATATFAQKNYSIAVETYPASIGATLGGATSTAKYNVEQTISTTEPTGYLFGGWYIYDAEDTEKETDLSEEIFTGTYEGQDLELSASFLMPDRNLVAEAYFDKIYTVSEFDALSKTDGTKYVIEGLICNVESYSNSKYITYDISDNGVNSGITLKIYKGLGLNGASFSAATDLNVGERVRVYGAWDNSHTDIAQDSKLYYHQTLSVASVAIGGSAEKTAYSPSDNTFSFAGLTATATYNTGYVKDVTAEATWTANSANPYTVAATGDVTVRATFGGQYGEETVGVTYTAKTVKSIYLEYESTYTFKGYDLPKPKVYAKYVEEIDDDEITSLVEAANGYDTESAYNKNTPDNYTIKVEYESFNAEYTVQVRKIFDNEDAPHNVADATALIVASVYQSTTSSTDYMWVRGIVSGFNGTYNNRYYISDDGTTTGQLYVFNGSYFNGAAFTADNKLKVGDEVILKATILNYNGNTPELTGSQVTYQLRDPAFAFADVVAGDEFEAGFSADMTIEPTSNEGEAEFTLSSGNTDAVTIVAGKLHAVAEGDAEITASRAATDNTGSINYKAKNATFNVHVIAERTRYAITMDKNGGSGVDPVYENQLAGATVDLPADNTYSKANSAFDAWVVTETVSGDAVAVTDGHFTMPAAAVTIQATWNDVETCTISFMVSGSEVATADAPQTVAYSLAEVAHPTVEGFTFIGWSETEYDDETTTLPTTITSYTPAVNEDSKTLYGIYSQVVGGASNKHYVLDYADESLATNTSWGEYATAYEYTAADGGEWIIKAYKSSGMQINTGKSAYIKVPVCSAKIIQISLTCNSGAKAALKFAETTDGESIADGSSSTSQTLDLSGESVTTGYILPTGNCQITHIDVEYSGNVTYYTSSPITRYTITYAKGDATGVTGLCEAQRHAAGEITLCAAPTCADKNFVKWSDGTSLYAAGTSYTLSADVTFTATWTPKPKYTVTYTANGGVGTAPAVEEYMEGETVEVKENEYFEKPGFVYAGWQVVYNDGTDHIITPNDEGEFEMVAYNVTIKALWEEPSNQKWVRVESTDELDTENGTNYIIVGASSDVAMGALNGSYYNSVGIVKTGNYLNGPESMTKVTLEEGSATGKFAIKHGTKYIYSGSAKSIGEQNDASDWTITIADGVASIKTGTGDGWYLKYNSKDPRFNTYASGQQAVAIYREKALTPIDQDGMTEADVNTYDDVEIGQDKTWTVSDEIEVGDVYMKEGAVIANSAEVTANDLYFKARHGKSNQIFDLSQITVVSNMYYDFQLCDGDVDANYWYSISVPFDVDLNDGVFQVGGTTPLVNHTDFEVWEYNTAYRAQTQSNGWQRSKDNMMHAGKAYLIGFNPGQPNIIRLKATADWKEHLFSGTSMSVVSTGGSGTHDNWNGLANPTGRYIDVNADAQVFNNNTHQFDPFTYDAQACNFVVGTAFFVQTASAIAISNTDHGQYRAPKRADETKCAYAVRITRDEATSFDNQIIVRASEEATGEYTQGHDMLTMNNATSKTAAMLWTENYGGKRLAIEEAAWMEDKASYVLKMYAPTAGTYHISVAETKANADLYLTYEGTIIWNLSMGEYPVDLNKGTTNGYGLLLQKKAPSVATGVETVTGDGLQVTGVQKIVIDDQVFILRGGKMYGVDGKMVK